MALLDDLPTFSDQWPASIRVTYSGWHNRWAEETGWVAREQLNGWVDCPFATCRAVSYPGYNVGAFDLTPTGIRSAQRATIDLVAMACWQGNSESWDWYMAQGIWAQEEKTRVHYAMALVFYTIGSGDGMLYGVGQLQFIDIGMLNRYSANWQGGQPNPPICQRVSSLPSADLQPEGRRWKVLFEGGKDDAINAWVKGPTDWVAPRIMPPLRTDGKHQALSGEAGFYKYAIPWDQGDPTAHRYYSNYGTNNAAEYIQQGTDEIVALISPQGASTAATPGDWVGADTRVSTTIRALYYDGTYVYAAGDGGVLIRYQSSHWQAAGDWEGYTFADKYPNVDIYDVICCTNAIYLAASDGLYAYYTSIPGPKQKWSKASVAGPIRGLARQGGSQEVYAVGNSGYIVKASIDYYGTWTLTTEHPAQPGDPDWNAMVACDNYNADKWVVASNGKIWHKDSTTGGYMEQAVHGYSGPLYSVAAHDENSAYAVGNNGVILQYNPSTTEWNVVAQLGPTLRSVWVDDNSPDRVLVCGDYGAVYQKTEINWNAVGPGDRALCDVIGTYQTTWIGGTGGYVARSAEVVPFSPYEAIHVEAYMQQTGAPQPQLNTAYWRDDDLKSFWMAGVAYRIPLTDQYSAHIPVTMYSWSDQQQQYVPSTTPYQTIGVINPALRPGWSPQVWNEDYRLLASGLVDVLIRFYNIVARQWLGEIWDSQKEYSPDYGWHWYHILGKWWQTGYGGTEWGHGTRYPVYCMQENCPNEPNENELTIVQGRWMRVLPQWIGGIFDRSPCTGGYTESPVGPKATFVWWPVVHPFLPAADTPHSY